MVFRWSFRPLVLFELQTPDFAWKFIWTVPKNYENFFGQGRQKGEGVSGISRGNSAIFELHTPDLAWKFIWVVSTNFEQNANFQKNVKTKKAQKVQLTVWTPLIAPVFIWL